MRESIPVNIGACFLVDSPTVIPTKGLPSWKTVWSAGTSRVPAPMSPPVLAFLSKRG